MTARLTDLETILVNQANRTGTPFDKIQTVSNPGIEETEGSYILQVWFEALRTLSKSAIAQVIREEQEILIGTSIMISASTEEQARQKCYELLEELEDRFVGFMPTLSGTEVIFPMHDVEVSFTQLEQSGIFALQTFWSFTWFISKGVKT